MKEKFKIVKKVILIFLSIFLVIAAVFCFKRGQSNKERPNLILISIDCLRADHVSSYGYYRETTPNIDNFAKEGILFKNYISQSYQTSMSEMSVHTGMYPSSNGVLSFDTILSKNILTLSEILKIYNYRNAAFGNSPEFGGFPALKKNFSPGFDVYNFVDYTSSVNQESIFNFFKKKSEAPFFLWLTIGSNHFPYGKSFRKFGDLNYKGPLKNKKLSTGDGVFPWIYNNVLYDPDTNNKINLNKEDIQYVIDRYDDDIFLTDEWLGVFFKQLKKAGLDKNTIIIIQSEHGEAFGEQGYILHYDIFDNTIKTPLLIKVPSLKKKGLIIDNQAQGIDLLPTILDLLDIPKAHQIEGSSLTPIIEGTNKEKINEYIFIERPFHTLIWNMGSDDSYIAKKRMEILQSIIIGGQSLKNYIESIGIESFFMSLKDIAIRTNNWKLIYRKSKDFEEKYSWWVVMSGLNKKMADYELYNLKIDPGEKENVIDKYPDVANELRVKLDLFIKQQEDKRAVIQLEETIQDYF